MGSLSSNQKDSEFDHNRNKKSYCCVCNIVDDHEIHEKELEHLSKMDYFSKYFDEISEDLVECKICTEDVIKDDVNKHAIQHELIPWHRPKDEFQNYFINFISLNNDTYWCYLCGKEINYWFQAISHFTDPEHLLHMAKTDIKMVNLSFPSEFYKKCVSHRIFPFSINKIKCLICDYLIAKYEDIEEHVSEINHKELHFISKQTDNNLLFQITEYKVSQSSSVEFYLQYFKNFIGIIEKNKPWCYLCREQFSDQDTAIDHIEKPKHQSVLITPVDNNNIDTSLSPDFYKKCIKHSIFPKSLNKLKCIICNCCFPGYENIDEHISGKHHRNTKKQHDSFQRISKDLFLLFYKNFIGIIRNVYWCFICHKECYHWHSATSHLQSSKHRSNMKGLIDIKDINMTLAPSYYENCVQQGIFPVSFNNVRCFICNHNISLYLNAEEHSTSIRHKEQYLVKKSPPKGTLSVENFCNEKKSGESTLKSSQSNESDDHYSTDKNDVPETWETIIDPEYTGKVISTLESRALKNENANAKVKIFNSVQIKNETDNDWILVDSMDDKAKIKNLNSKTTNSKLKSSKKSQQRKLSIINSKKARKINKIKQKLDKPSLQKTNKISRFQVSNRKQFFFCIICKKKLKSEVFLHNHLTNHFCPRFIQQNNYQTTTLNLSSKNCRLTENQNFIKSVDTKSFASAHTSSNTGVKNSSILKRAFDDTSHITQSSTQIYNTNSLCTQIEILKILNLNSEKLNGKTKRNKRKKKKNLKIKGLKPCKINKSHRSNQLTINEKCKNNEYLVKAADILESNKPRQIDLYKIDPIQLKMINLSMTRCFPLDEENVYCLICKKKMPYTVMTVFEHFRSINHNDYLLKMIQDHIKFMSFPDQLTDLSLAREWMEDISDKFVKCYACQKKINNNISTLNNHLIEQNHMYQRAKTALKMDKFCENLHSRMERNWYKVRSYWCVPCCKNYSLENEFYKHINISGEKNKKHLEQCQKLSKYANFILDYCPTCTTLFYGFQNTFAYHCENEKHKYFRERPFYAANQLPSAVEEMLSNSNSEINKMIELLDANIQKQQEDVKLIIQDLEIIVNHSIPAKAYPFGSRVNGVSLETSDLDVFLDCEDRYYKGRRTDDVSHILKQVEDSLKSCPKIWTINRTILDCAVPIIRVTHKPLGIECDISFLNGLTTECSQLIKTINQKLPLCRKLILFVKQWINKCNMSGEKGISNYAITWMIIYYLQTKSLIPAIITLIKDRNESKMIGGWETGASLDFSISESNESFKDLLKGFFKMITTFDFRNNIICPLLGKPVEKISFSDPKTLLPSEMTTYKQYCKRKNHELFRIDSPLCVQDPYDLSNNITKATKKIMLSRFLTYSTLTYIYLD